MKGIIITNLFLYIEIYHPIYEFVSYALYSYCFILKSSHKREVSLSTNQAALEKKHMQKKHIKYLD